MAESSGDTSAGNAGRPQAEDDAREAGLASKVRAGCRAVL